VECPSESTEKDRGKKKEEQSGRREKDRKRIPSG
jgi:hypothetical protein